MGSCLWVVWVFSWVLAGCSCGGIVIDSSAGHGGKAGSAPMKPTGTGGVPNTVGSGGAGGDVVDAGEDLVEPKSGTVIDVQGVTADGHPAIVQSVRDRAHGVHCDVRLARDGSSRCLPAGEKLEVWFSDSDCKNPVAVDTNNGPAPSRYSAAMHATSRASPSRRRKLSTTRAASEKRTLLLAGFCSSTSVRSIRLRRTSLRMAAVS
jgi:hypothetical protein